MRTARRLVLAVAALLSWAAPLHAADIMSLLQGHEPGMGQGPTSGPARSIGGAANGCLAGGQSLPLSGPGWEVLRPERNRFWGNPALITFLKDMASRSHDELGSTLLVADMAQPRGGRMPSGHGSHQTGVDADILFRLATAPLTKAERTEPVMDSVLLPKGAMNPKLWGQKQVDLVRLFASDQRVERIFVNPAIKAALCKGAGGNRSWLRRVRPWWGHDEHLHVRIACPMGDMDCVSGPPLPEGDGCGAELQSWIVSGAWAVKPTGGKRGSPHPPLACREVLGKK